MNIGYFSPSYKRAEKSKTQLLYNNIKLIVAEKEKELYEENGNIIEVCPDEIQGNIARVRNYILDTYLKKYDAVVIIDDDCSGIGRWENQEYKIFNEEELKEFFEKMYIITKEYGFYLFGLNCVSDKGAYREHSPFSTNKFIGAPCSMILKNNICRYDEEIPLKEDYDFTLQNLKQYRGALRCNYANYNVKQAQQTGGCASQRNSEEEEKQFNRLVEKWGSKIIQRDTKSKKQFDFNPILKTPLKGI